MIKDRAQKQMAARFCASQGIVPFAEVVVRSPTGLEDTVVDITDVDVLGIELRQGGLIRRLLFDCKTASKQSAINRSLWAGGLKSFVNADVAYVIQKRSVPETHKLAASTFGVFIHTEDSFRRYAESLSPDFSLDITYLDDMDTWDNFVSLGQKQPTLSDMMLFSNTHAALELSAPKGVRVGLGALLKVAGELDPGKPSHHFVFRSFLSSFLIFLTLAAGAVKDVFSFSMDRSTFEHRLRYYLWEGRDNYFIRSQMRKAALERSGGNGASELELPEWPRLVELMRTFLDAPATLAPLSFISKELAFRKVAARPKAAADGRIRKQLESSNRSRQFIFAVAGYITAAAKLPKEFATELEADLNSLLDRPKELS